ncbi:DNA-binding virion core protein [Turkeypox virus]|uniref:Core protein VP8 n=1 Tax=Turkeypox virus TaxID=336486 RepID=A0A0M3ZEM5_9POXV|nr:DNA-binding virion core protein [Turkeypox virus]ALA62468.1 DNA-binding virion core protein [Turkeypox virus]
MNNFPLENLFGEKALCVPMNREHIFQIIACGAKLKFPKSLLSMYKIIPRMMTKYPMKLVSNESITGVVITTTYNLKKNLSIPAENKLTKQDIETYYLNKNIEVLNLMIGNTSVKDLSCEKPKPRASKNKRKEPTIFLGIASPLILVMTSKKPVNVYVIDKKSEPTADYVNITPGTAILETYGNTQLLDIHSPGSVLNISAIYGLDANMELKKLNTVNEIENYQTTTIGKAVDLKKFIELFANIKKYLSLSNFTM